MIAQILRQTAAVQIPKNSDCQAYPVYLLLHRKLFRITIDMKRKKKVCLMVFVGYTYSH